MHGKPIRMYLEEPKATEALVDRFECVFNNIFEKTLILPLNINVVYDNVVIID